MRVTVLELPARWGDPLAALDAVDEALAAGPPTDLVLLPEASLTGYVSPQGDFDLLRFAEPEGGPTAERIREVARRRGVALVAPLILEEGGSVFNAMRGVDAEGLELFTYRKRHPWYPETWATAGTAPLPTARVAGVTVTICICFDIHFVVPPAADLLLFASAWVDDESQEADARGRILRDLAQRRRLAIANANWGRGAVEVAGQGGSRILGPDGRELVRVSSVASAARLARADATLEVEVARD